MQIGGVTIHIESGAGDICSLPDIAYKEFEERAAGAEGGAAHINVVLEPGINPAPTGMDRIFDSGSSWSMFFDGENRFVSMKPAEFEEPIWLAKIGKDYRDVNVYCSDVLLEIYGGLQTISNPVRYPLDQILLMYFLSMRNGALIHAAGVEVKGKGLIFPGKSGAGKSTLCHLLSGEGDIRLLSDDRVIVRKEEGRFLAYGTPWPGEAGIASNKRIPLHGLMFLKKGTQNSIKRISRSDTLEKLMPVTSIPWFDAPVMEEILELCGTLSSAISAYELEFKPDAGAADVISRFMQDTA